MTDAENKGPIDEKVLFDAIRDNFSPEAVAAMAMYLQAADTRSAEVNRQLLWLSNELATLVGGSEMLTDLANEIGL